MITFSNAACNSGPVDFGDDLRDTLSFLFAHATRSSRLAREPPLIFIAVAAAGRILRNADYAGYSILRRRRRRSEDSDDLSLDSRDEDLAQAMVEADMKDQPGFKTSHAARRGRVESR